MKNPLIASLILVGAACAPVLSAGAPPLPQAIERAMKKGKELDRVWFRPGWDRTSGFIVGKVVFQADAAPEIVHVVREGFPATLGRLAISTSPNTLVVTVTDVAVIPHKEFGLPAVTLEVDGRVLAPDQTVLMAFIARERNATREDAESDAQACMDRIAWSLAKDLGPDWQRALEASRNLGQAAASAPALNLRLGPQPPAAAQSPQERLLALEDLKRKGLVTPEEYQALSAKILAGH